MAFVASYSSYLRGKGMNQSDIEIALSYFTSTQQEENQVSKTKRYLPIIPIKEEELTSPVEVTIISPYMKTNVLLGDFKDRYADFKDEFLKKERFKYNGNLKIGHPGWIFQDTKIVRLEKELKRREIPYVKMTKTEFENSQNANSSEEKIPSKKSTLKVNKWGNKVDTETDFVFMDLPIGRGKEMKSVVVGVQDIDKDKSKKGLDSVLPLNDTFIKECKEKNFAYITQNDLNLVFQRNKKVGEKLRDMYPVVEEEYISGSEDDLDSD